MTENMDIQLKTMFAEEGVEIEANGFVNDVMARTRFLKYRLPFLLGSIVLAVLICAMLLAPALQGFAWMIAGGLTTGLVDLGEGWVALFLAPLNTVGSLLIMAAKAVRILQKKLTG